jgi:uncharacterized protein
MEDILASIRRIISEDDDQGRKPAEAPLQLTTPAQPDDIEVFDDEPPAPTPQLAPPPVVAAPVARAPIPQPAPAPTQGAYVDDDSFVSPQAVNATASAFTRLSGSLRIAEAPGQTVEGVVRELLRPMLKDWLEANLPAIVEARVEAELERISRMAR